jgi:hypothetical protein
VRKRNSNSVIWFTEQGARWNKLSESGTGHTDFGAKTDPATDTRTDDVMKQLITSVIGRNSRIRMFLAYQMVSHEHESWDSGLLRYSGDPGWQLWSPRKMWHTYKAKANP